MPLQWLEEALRASTAPWPLAGSGAHAVISGHNHLYEPLTADRIPYLINGAGGKQRYRTGPPEPNSHARCSADHGAILVDARRDFINFSFYYRAAERIDSITILAQAAAISH